MSDIVFELREASRRQLAIAPDYVDKSIEWLAADKIEALRKQLAESEAREAKLYEALEDSNALNINWADSAELDQLEYLSEYREVIKTGTAALALPHDNTALAEAINQAKREVLRGLTAQPDSVSLYGLMRRMIEEIK